MVGKIFTLNELRIGSQIDIEPALFPGLKGEDALTSERMSTLNAAIGVPTMLNGTIAKGIHHLFVDTRLIEVVSLPNSDYLAARLRTGGSTNWARMDTLDDGTKLLLTSGPSMRVSMFMPIVAQVVTVFMLANKHKFPEVMKEFEGALNYYLGGFSDADKEKGLCRLSDAVSTALESIVGHTHPDLGGFGFETTSYMPETVTQADPDRLLQSCFTEYNKLKDYIDLDMFAPVNGSNRIIVKGRYIGPLVSKVTRYIERVKHTLISGPTATGKTLAVEEACEATGAPLVILKGAEHLEDIDMLGGFMSMGGQISMVYGPLSRALKAGKEQYDKQLLEDELAKNEARAPKKIAPAVLFIDEINRLQSRFLNIMITAMNVTRATKEYCVEIPCNGEMVTCPEGYFMIIGAQNLGQLHSNTYATDLALDRRFHGKLNVDYLSMDAEVKLVRSVVTNLDDYLVEILCKVAHDTRYQISGAAIRAPIDTDTLLKWAEEIADYVDQGQTVDINLVQETAKDIVYGVCLERGTGSGFEPGGVKILSDNIQEAWKNGIVNRPATPPPPTTRKRAPKPNPFNSP